VDLNKSTPVDVGQVWWFWFSSSAFHVDKQLRSIFRWLPHDPRCKFCNAPFEGAGSVLVKALFGKQRSSLNPHFCNLCDEAMRHFPGGAEVEMAILFADVRGSTALSEKLSPTEFSRVIGRFYSHATKVIADADGLIEKLAGDSIAAYWGTGFAGPEYVLKTIRTAQELLKTMAKQGIPVGIGVHFGIAFFGAVGTPDGMTDITAAGEEVNLAARLASQAAAGEILLSTNALQAAAIDDQALETRSLELKGISQPVLVKVMHA
jgi:adenylate cyclase